MDAEILTKTDGELKKQLRIKHPDRVTLEPELLERLDRWIKQIVASRQGIRLARKDILEWFLNAQPEILAPVEVKKMGDRFYDEEWFLSNALAEIKEAKSRGEPLTLEDIRKRDSVAKTSKATRERVKLAPKSLPGHSPATTKLAPPESSVVRLGSK